MSKQRLKKNIKVSRYILQNFIRGRKTTEKINKEKDKQRTKN